MIYTGLDNLDDVLKVGETVKKEVNRMYKTLEIEIDGVFRTMLLLKKKKYAALRMEITYDKGRRNVKEFAQSKGLDLVRRDWCDLSKDVGQYVLDQILSGQSRDEVVNLIHTKMDQVRQQLEANAVPMSKFIITKSLTRDPADYADAKTQGSAHGASVAASLTCPPVAHVQVALRMRAAGKALRAGDFVEYVVCVSDDPQLANRCFHPSEVRKADGTLVIDKDWYIKHQILPPISRLCGPIDGTDAQQLAYHLGLDMTKYPVLSSGTLAWRCGCAALLTVSCSLQLLPTSLHSTTRTCRKRKNLRSASACCSSARTVTSTLASPAFFKRRKMLKIRRPLLCPLAESPCYDPPCTVLSATPPTTPCTSATSLTGSSANTSATTTR